MVTTELTTRQAQNRRYRMSDKGKIANHRAKAKNRLKNPEAIKARGIVNYAIRSGRLISAKDCYCHFCSKRAIQYHHADYSRPLDVEPICFDCHNILTFTASRIALIFARTVGRFITDTLAASHSAHHTFMAGRILTENNGQPYYSL